jgi:hypothetical protein
MDETALTPEPGLEPQPDFETEAEASKPKKRNIKKVLIPGLVVAGLVAGVATWVLIPKQDDLYFKALTDGGFAASFATQEIAVIQAKAVCAGLAGGGEPTGFDYQKVGVDFYCPDFSEIYKVVPTPEQQQKMLVTSLREADLGGLYPSEAAAVAAAQAVCTDLRNGGESQGVEASFIGVEIYCSEFASGYRVLKDIKVVGKFVISDDNYWLDLIYARNGECSGGGAYDDVYEGTRVVVRNGDGEKLTETALMQGKGNNSRCTFKIEFTVLEGEDTYEIEVGRRGTLSYTEAELKIPNKVAGYLG